MDIGSQQPMDYEYTSLTSLTPAKVDMTNFKTAIINAIGRNNYSGAFSPEWKKSSPEQKSELIKQALYDVADNTPRLGTLGVTRAFGNMGNTFVSNTKRAFSPSTYGFGRTQGGRKTHKKNKAGKTHKKNKARKMRKTKSKH